MISNFTNNAHAIFFFAYVELEHVKDIVVQRLSSIQPPIVVSIAIDSHYTHTMKSEFDVFSFLPFTM
jgi:hypothetical protein